MPRAMQAVTPMPSHGNRMYGILRKNDGKLLLPTDATRLRKGAPIANIESMKPRLRLSTKFFAIAIGLLLLALLSIGLTMSITRQLEGGAAAVNEAGRLRMQAWRLTSAVSGGREMVERDALLKQFDATMLLLHAGDLQRPLAVPWNAETRQYFAQMQQEWRVLQTALAGVQAVDLVALTHQVDAFVAKVDALVHAIEATMARQTAVLNLFQFLMMVMAIATAVLMLYVGYLFVVQPIERIHQGLRRVESGDFSVRLPADLADEFGDLAVGFNHMSATLQELYGNLERKVQEKTRDLEAKRVRLAALYEVSNFLVEAHTLEELANGFAQKLRRLAAADAVAVRWSDETTQRYIMLASEGLPDELVREERCLEAGLCACGQLQKNATTRVIPIVAVGEPRLGTCAKHGYAQLVSIPIRLQQRLLGEVDLFYSSERILDSEDRDLFDALAVHLANAVETLRTEALIREAAVSQERTMLARELHDSIAQSLSFLKIQVNLLRQAIEHKDAEKMASTLAEIDTGVKESTQDVRELLVHFRTRTDRDDIEHALRTTLRKFEQQSGLQTQLAFHGHGVSLPQDVQLQVLHVVQEALSNVRKHAAAKQVTLDVFREPKWVFRVRDDGRGFAPGMQRDDDTHVGLHIMRERAERIGAKVQVESSVGRGTEVCIALPV
jgi:two-component system, NarL family, nitrate/nitrite sensor histidine kinase NarX